MMLQGTTLLRTSNFNPRLSDSQKRLVLDVLGGKWDYEELLLWAELADARLAQEETRLPKEPYRDVVESILIDVNRKFLGATL